MIRKPSALTWRCTALLLPLVVGMFSIEAEAGLLAPSGGPKPTRVEADGGAGAIAADPVVAEIDAIGTPASPPQLDDLQRGAITQRMSGGDGGADAIFPGGTASSVGGLRFLEGVSEARDPLQLLPPEPAIVTRVPEPGAALLLLTAALSLLLLRRRVSSPR